MEGIGEIGRMGEWLYKRVLGLIHGLSDPFRSVSIR